MNNLNISQWGGYLQNIADNKELFLVSDNVGHVQIINKKHMSENYKRLNINQIIQTTLEIFEKSNDIGKDDRLHIMNGLKSLKQRRHEKYNALNIFRKFFAGRSQIERDIAKIGYMESLIQVGDKYTNRILKDFEQEIPEDMAPEVIELTIATLLKSQKITEVSANHTTIYKICEKAAQKYLEKNEVHNAFRVRMLVAKQLGPDPLLDFTKTENAHIGNLDSCILKNGSLRTEKIMIDGKSYMRIICKVNSPEREKMNITLDKLRKESNCQEVLRLLPKDFCNNLQVKECQDGYYCTGPDRSFSVNNRYNLGSATDIHFGNAGYISVGSDLEVYTQYNRLQVLIPSDTIEMEKTVHTMLSAVGLGSVLLPQRTMDDERMKMFCLLRYFYPKEALAFETNEYYFDTPLSLLQRDIMAKVPGMEKILMKYLVDNPELMYKQEIYQGKEVWAVRDGADAIKKAGGVGLMAGVGFGGAKTSAFQTVAKMLEHGALSSQDRFEKGWIVKGASSSTDLRVGGGDHVYTRLITKSDISKRTSTTKFAFCGHVQILYDVKLLERGGFGFRDDQYGSKQGEAYKKRSNFVDLARGLVDEGSYSNEIMIKNRIPPQYIKGLVVANENDKTALLQTLRGAGRVELRDGKEFMKDLDVLATDFIHVGRQFKTDMWDVPKKI